MTAFLEDVMREAESYMDSFLQDDMEAEEWEQAEGSFGIELDSRPAIGRWRVNKDSLLPEIEVTDDKGRDYRVIMKMTRCADVVVYEWQCWDAYGLSGVIDGICAQRGRIIYP